MPTATPTDKHPSNHVTITDGSTTFGLNIVNAKGEPDERAFTRTPVPRTAIKTSTGSTKYGDFEFPWTSIAQDDWSGGRGNNNFDDDASRFADSFRLTSRHPKRLMLGGQETWTTGIKDTDEYMPGNVTWQPVYGASRFIAYKFTASATYTPAKIHVLLRRRGTPNGSLQVAWSADSAGDPGVPEAGAAGTVTTAHVTDTVSAFFGVYVADNEATGSSDYHVWIKANAVDDADDHWEVGVDAAGGAGVTQEDTDGNSWTSASYDLYFRISETTAGAGALFFQYKEAQYAVTNTEGTPKLWINGYRGVVTGAGSTTSILEDSTQSFTNDALIGGTLVLTAGNGSRIGRVSSLITDNDGTKITVSPALTAVPQPNDTEYVVRGLNTWTEIESHGLTGPITDVAVFDDTVYFAQGDWVFMRRMEESNQSASWVRSFRGENSRHSCTFLKVVHDVQRGDRLFGATNRDGLRRRAIFSSGRVPWGTDLTFPRLLEDCEDVWTDEANVTSSIDAADYRQGAGSLKLTITDTFTTGLAAHENITDTNLFGPNNTGSQTTAQSNQAFARINFWAKSSIAVDAGDLELRLASDDACTASIVDIDMGDMPAGVWMFIDKTITYSAELKLVKSVGVDVPNDQNATFTLHLDGIVAMPHAGTGSYTPLPSDQGRVTGLEAYGDPEECWVFREGGVGHLTNGLYVPIPLKEMGNARSRTNGAAHTVHGVYLYFSYLQGVERYYKNNLDDIGPDKDEGFPDERRGPVTSMVSYPGRIFMSVGAGSGRLSSIVDYNLQGYHEMYRANPARLSATWEGGDIDALSIEVVPGWSVDRLWFNQDGDLLWIPLPGNTLREDTDTSFRFTHEGTMESAWIYARMHEVKKLFNSLKVMQTGFVAGSQEIEADYRTDSTTTWTPLPSTFDTFVEEISFTSTTPPNVKGRRIRFRLRLQTDDNTLTPSVRATVLEAVGRVPIKYSWRFRFTAEDLAQDLIGRNETYDRAEDLMTQLDTWADSDTALTMRSNFSVFDNKSVLLDPASLRPILLVQDDQQEQHIGEMTLIEV